MRRLIAAALLLFATSAQATTIDSWRYNYVPDTGARQLLQEERYGFAIDATTVGNAEYVGGPDGGTIAIHADNVTDKIVPMDAAAGLLQGASPLVQSGTSPKMVQWGSSPYVRWTPHNYALYSQELDNGVWSTQQASVTTNSLAAPDGTTTAETLTGNSTTGSGGHDIFQHDVRVAGVPHTQSIYAKKGTNDFIFISIEADDGSGATAVFDVNAGTAGETTSGGGGTVHSSSITSVGGGWYRCELAATLTDDSVYYVYGLAQAATGNSFPGGFEPDFNASGKTAYLWGANFNRGYRASPYLIQQGLPRIGIPQAYDVAASKYGVLVEPAATNLTKYSENFNNSTDWDHNSGAAITYAADTTDTTAPDGSSTADKFTAGGGGGMAHGAYQLNLGGSSGLLTVSAYAKAGTAGYAVLRAGDDDGLTNSNQWVAANYRLSDCTVDNHDDGTTAITYVSASAVSVGNGWCRLSLTGTNDGTGASTWEFAGVMLQIGASPTYSTYGDAYFSSDGVTGYFWGYQAEAGSVASSYIPTLGATVTRAVDNVTVALSALPFSATEGTVYLDFINARDTVLLDIHNGTTDERIDLDTVPPAVELTVADGASAQAALSSGVSGLDGARHQTTAAWAANDFDIVTDAAAAASDGSGTLPTMTTLSFGRNSSGSAASGFLSRFVYVPRQVETDNNNIETWRYNF